MRSALAVKLPAASVVGPFDPGHDGDAELVAGPPAAGVEHVLLQQREERFHGGVVRRGADVAHRSDHAMTGQVAVDLPCAKLAAPVGVKDAAGGVFSAGHGHLDRGDDEAGLHPFIDRPADESGATTGP